MDTDKILKTKSEEMMERFNQPGTCLVWRLVNLKKD